jgi:predicted  nucleic acid-binding Zn-ribbon protein
MSRSLNTRLNKIEEKLQEVDRLENRINAMEDQREALEHEIAKLEERVGHALAQVEKILQEALPADLPALLNHVRVAVRGIFELVDTVAPRYGFTPPEKPEAADGEGEIKTEASA